MNITNNKKGQPKYKFINNNNYKFILSVMCRNCGNYLGSLSSSTITAAKLAPVIVLTTCLL